MYKYIFKRILMLVPVIIGVSLLVFFIINLSPGDPAEIILGNEATQEQINQLREEMGLNEPLVVRYFGYMSGFIKGDLGNSYRNNLPIKDIVAEKLSNTGILALSATAMAIAVGLPLGILSAKKQNSYIDNFSMVFALLGQSAPSFWQGLLLVLIFSLGLGWLPSSGMGEGFLPMLKSLILPALTAGTGTLAVITRTTRSSILEVMRQDYIDTARSKGITESKVTNKHMLRNALIPIVTVIGLQFGVLLGGSVTTETVFAWPGLGKFVVDSIRMKDTPAVMGSIITLCILVSVVNLIVDILYAYIDPRIKSQYK